MNPPAQPKPKRRSIASWIPMMLMLSLGLHGIVLFLPISSSDEEPIPPPNPEGESITVTRVPTNSGVNPEAKTSSNADTNGASRRPATSASGKTAATSTNAASRTQAGRTQTHRSQGRTGQDSSSGRSTSAQASTPTRTQGAGQTPSQTSSAASASVPNLGTSSTAATPQVSQALRDRIAELEQNYRYDPWRTTPQEALDVFQTWTTTVQEKTGIPFFFPQRIREPLTVEYPLRVCLPIEPTAASLGVLTDANGAIVGDPEIIRSTGYEWFNAAAIAQVKAQSFPQNAKFKAYTFEVQVEYDATHCLGASAATN